MIKYKGFAFFRCKEDYWRVITPNRNFNFVIRFPGGLREMMERVDLWRSIIDNDNY